MPDSTQLPKPTTAIQLFDNSLKNTEQTQLFSTDGARILIILQKATHLGTSARTITSHTLVAGGNAADTVVDDNLSSGAGQKIDGTDAPPGLGQFEIIVDFGSIATRTINTKATGTSTTNSSSSGSVSCGVSFSTDNVSYSGGGGVLTVSGQSSMTINGTATRGDTINMRYAKFTTSSAPGGGTTYQSISCVEIWDPTSGLGTSSFKIQIKNPDTGEWFDYIPASEFVTQDSDVGSTDLVTVGENATKKYVLPFEPTLVRGVLTPSGGVNTRVTVLRIHG